MKKFFISIVFLGITHSAFSQITELGISKFFADTSTITFAKPDSGQFIRTYPYRFIEDTVGKLLKISESYFDTLAMIIEACPDCIFEIGVHTESKGPDKQNLNVSLHRANSFMNFLVRNCNEPGDHIRVKGYGETRLLNRCDDNIPCTPEESTRNRRVEITIVGFKKA